MDYSICTGCGNSGWFIVPHPDFVVDGVWLAARLNEQGHPVRITGAVTCSCLRGRDTLDGMRAKSQRCAKPKDEPGYVFPPMSLEKFKELLHPDPRRLESETLATDRNRTEKTPKAETIADRMTPADWKKHRAAKTMEIPY